MIGITGDNVKAKEEGQNIYGLAKRHYSQNTKSKEMFSLLTGSPCFPGSPAFPGFPEMPSVPWYPCSPFGPGRPGSPLVVKNYLIIERYCIDD